MPAAIRAESAQRRFDEGTEKEWPDRPVLGGMAIKLDVVAVECGNSQGRDEKPRFRGANDPSALGRGERRPFEGSGEKHVRTQTQGAAPVPGGGIREAR